jgi:hypothetical protein
MATPTDKSAKQTKRKETLIESTLHGRWLSTRFFGRHWGAILALVVMVLIYITNRYQCLTAMENIQKLEKELMVVKTDRIREKSTYMSNVRESAMKQRIDGLGLNLEISERPPYKLTLDK